ncbi:RHS repeat protein, partial [Luteimonas gilva]
ADDQITAIEYWPTGLVKKVTQPDGAFTAYTYDAAHRLTDIADNAGNTIHYTLDNAGNRTAESTKDAGNTLRRTLSRVYNQLGQLQTAKDAYNHATGFTYDANGNNQTVTDALSRVSDNDYDPLNRLVQTLQDVGGIAAQTSFAYDAQDNLTKVTDPKGLDTTYTYNGFSDLTQLSSPDTGVTTYTYDSAGNRQTQTDARGVTATYSYDALNRLTGIGYPTSSLDVAYAYDTVNASCLAGETFAIGRLTKMTDSSGQTEYCYDRFGNLTRKRQTTNGQVFTVRYAYTLAGQLQAITYPDGAVVDYVRDGQGRTTEVGVTPNGGTRSVLLNQATYYPFGPVASWTYGNGRTMSRSLNQNYQPLAIQDPNAGGLSLGYEFDEVGNLKKLFNADQSVTKAQYGYDALNRLTDVKDGPTGTVIDHYAYDATGNRTSFTNAGGTTNYTYPSTNHRLTQVGATPRAYDSVGNTTQIGGTAKEFVYNDANRMSQVKVGGTATMNYQLSGRGEQVRQYLAANNTYTVYNEAGQWVGDYDATGQPIQQAIWLDDLPVGLLAGATTNQKLHYLQPDHLGTPRAVIDT